jgi:hypothetical protein
MKIIHLKIAFICSLLLAACAEKPPEITAPNNRIQYFLARESHRMTSQQKYQEFIERELGSYFHENDFVAYIGANEAECDRDPENNILYCVYVDFKVVPRDSDLWKTMNAVSYFCFWVLPPADRPTVRFSQVGAGSVAEFPTNRAGFARAHNFPGCRARLLKFQGYEK